MNDPDMTHLHAAGITRGKEGPDALPTKKATPKPRVSGLVVDENGNIAREKTPIHTIEIADGAGVAHTDKGTATIQLFGKDTPSTPAAAAATPMTFFVTAADASGVNKVAISPGAINSQICPVTSLSVSDGDAIWIAATFNSEGTVVTGCTVANGEMPGSNTPTVAYKLLAAVAIVSGATAVTPYGWNFTDASACGSDGSGNLIVNWS